MSKLNILVFPCGSEIGLEIYRSLKFSRHVKLYGISSVNDHGRFVYENYTGDFPFFSESGFIEKINEYVILNKIDAIYPAMDSVIDFFSRNGNVLKCKIIGSKSETNGICLSKTKTYQALAGKVKLPKLYKTSEEIDSYPVFMKPDIGYGSRGASIIHNKQEVVKHLEKFSNSIILENLPGAEYTIDCFTNRKGELLFTGPRQRSRISNGISVNTYPVVQKDCFFKDIAIEINRTLDFRGAWFFQVKEDSEGNYKLLEVASRLGGSSSLFRNKGVNFALLSVFDSFNFDVELFTNDFSIELDRALQNRYKISIEYNKVYVDFDDCIRINQELNTTLISFLIQCLNDKVKVVLITKHEFDINKTLNELRISDLFDEIIHLNKSQNKFEFMDNKNAVFIDDSYEERKQVYQELKIPVFAPDAVESLLK